MARSSDANRANPDPTASLSDYVQPIVRPDRSTYAPDSKMDPKAVPPTLDSVGPASRTSPLGQQTAGRR